MAVNQLLCYSQEAKSYIYNYKVYIQTTGFCQAVTTQKIFLYLQCPLPS